MLALGLVGAAFGCEDNPRVRTLDPVEAVDMAGDIAPDMAADMAVDAAPDEGVEAPAPCVVSIAPVAADGSTGPALDCDIAPPLGCESLARCACTALAVDDVDGCVAGLTQPRALISLADECDGQVGLDEICRRDLWQMSAPGKIAVECSPGCADVPATLAER